MKRRGSTALVCGLSVLSITGISQAAPAWYGANGGFIADNAAQTPTVPDFFQHQYWTPTVVQGRFVSANGWETNFVQSNTFGSGWCGYTSYTDLFYDMQSRGYSFGGLADPTGANWYTATYGTAPVNNVGITTSSSNITKLASYFAANLPRSGTTGISAYGVTLQSFLNASVNNNSDNNGMARLISQNYVVNSATGNVSYWSYSAGRYVSTASKVVAFTNNQLKAGNDVAYQLYTSQQNAVAKQLWWGNHVVAVSGIDTRGNGTVFVSDPDSNPNPAAPPANLSAPSNWPFPGTIPAGLKTAAGAGLPVPANPDATVAASYNSNYDDFSFTNASVTSGQAPQFTNSTLGFIYTIQQSGVKNINAARRVRPGVALAAGVASPAAAPSEEETDITLSIPSDLGPVDKVLIEPSSPTIDPSLDPTADTLVDDTDVNNSIVSNWSDAMDTSDPFGNLLTDDAIEYDLSGGSPLMAGDTADINLATADDFSLEGYDVLYHVQGDASDQWDVEMVPGTASDAFNPSDSPAIDEAVPEPASFTLLGAASLLILRRRRRDDSSARSV